MCVVWIINYIEWTNYEEGFEYVQILKGHTIIALIFLIISNFRGGLKMEFSMFPCLFLPRLPCYAGGPGHFPPPQMKYRGVRVNLLSSVPQEIRVLVGH